jgi:NADPH:quinone reductase-like Zn-dependent oxidoreductase
MKAVRFHEHGPREVLRYEDVPTPSPGAGDVLVRVARAA